MINSGLFTSESVSDGHPDKICDQISDAILDACLKQDPDARVAIETAIKGSTLCLLGEITSNALIEPAGIARKVLDEVGHTEARWGLDPASMRIIQDITRQSPEIKSGVDGTETGAGDQGLMFGYACDEGRDGMPLPITLAHALTMRHRAFRYTDAGQVLGPDAKSQVTFRYQDGRPGDVDSVVFSTQHTPDIGLDALRELVHQHILAPVLRELLTPQVKLYINPAGPFTTGGPIADAGLTGRKIIVDSYGGSARHGGGAFSGKDATKVDRSAAYAARQIARDVVSRGWARACEVRVAYAIGMAKPVGVSFETFGTATEGPPADLYRDVGIDIADLMRPQSIIERLQLNHPVFQATSTFGHFGRPGFRWEQPLHSDQTTPPAETTLILSREAPITETVRRYAQSISHSDEKKQLANLQAMERLVLADHGARRLGSIAGMGLSSLSRKCPDFYRLIRVEIGNAMGAHSRSPLSKTAT